MRFNLNLKKKIQRFCLLLFCLVALILVNWKSKKLWKSIPMSEVNVVQQKFEDNVKAALNVGENPFALIYEGELDKQR